MNKTTTIICCFLFFLSGAMTAIVKGLSQETGYKTMAAATMPNYQFPTNSIDTIVLPDLPRDLLLDLAKKKGLNTTTQTTVGVDSAMVDSLRQRIIDLEQKGQVTKVKWRRVPAPAPIVKTDTIQVPVYYLATQVGTKESPTGECVSVYEVHKVDEICPEITNSYVDNGVGD